MKRRPAMVPAPAEADLLTSVLSYLKTRRVKGWRCNSGTIRLRGRVFRGAPKGTPDILGYLGPRGRMFAIELKAKTGRVSIEQEWWEQEALAAGVLVLTARSLEEVHAGVGQWLAMEGQAS